MYNVYVNILRGVKQSMLKNILIEEYKSVFKDIINEYNNIINKNNGYFNYLKIINYEVKTIISAFKTLINERKNIFSSIFEDGFESVLYAIDRVLFDHIKSIFENVSLLLNIK